MNQFTCEETFEWNGKKATIIMLSDHLSPEVLLDPSFIKGKRLANLNELEEFVRNNSILHLRPLFLGLFGVSKKEYGYFASVFFCIKQGEKTKIFEIGSSLLVPGTPILFFDREEPETVS